MTMQRNLNERKKGIRDVCKKDGRGFGTIVILPLCHSSSLFLLQIPLSLSLFLCISIHCYHLVCFLPPLLILLICDSGIS